MGNRTNMEARSQPGGFIVAEDMGKSTGSRYYVGSVTGTDGAGYGRSPDTPTATIDYAVGLCTANKGDIIYVMPGHTESLTGATSLAIDVAGISIIGLGRGDDRPTLTLTTAAAATVAITVASVYIENIVFVSAFTNGVTAGFTVGAGGDGLVLKNIEMRETLNTQGFLIAVSIAALCNNVVIDGLEFYGVTGGSDSECINFAGASNYSKVINCKLYGDFAGAVIDALTAKSLYVTIANNIISNDDGAAGLSISVKSDTTGMMAYNNVYQGKDTVGPAGAAMSYVQNFVTNAAGVQGILKPAADS